MYFMARRSEIKMTEVLTLCLHVIIVELSLIICQISNERVKHIFRTHLELDGVYFIQLNVCFATG